MKSNKTFCVKLIHCGNKNIINPKDHEQKNIFFMPMGLFPLANELKKDGLDVEIIHTDLQPGHTLHQLLHVDTIDAVGFDCHWVNESLAVLETARALKQANPHIYIFLGGFTASLFAREIITNYSQVDAVVRGDGEVPIVELVRALQAESPQDELQGVQNLVWRGADKTVHVNEITYVACVENMERLDFAAVELLRNWQFYRAASSFYSHFTPINSTPMFLLEPGRGCQYGCTFCGGNSLAQKKINNRTKTVFRSVDSVLDTLKKARGFGFKTFYTCMESEESDPWYIRLLKKIQEQKLDINYGYGCWRLPSGPLVDALSEACSQVVIEISPETSDIEIRRQNKDTRIYYTNKELEDCLDYIAGKNNVKVQLFFGYYLASDNQQTVLNTIEYIIKLLIKYHGLVEIEYANFSTDPGSLFFFNPQKYCMDIKVRSLGDYIACLKQNYVEKEGQAADMTLFRPQHISPEEDTEIHRKVMLFDYLFTTFRKSVSYILKKTGNPQIIVEFLENSDIPADSFNRFPIEQVRRMLVDNCMQEDILDLYLSKLIVFETRNQQVFEQISRPTVQLYLDHQEVEGLLQEEEISSHQLLHAQYKMEEIDGFDF